MEDILCIRDYHPLWFNFPDNFAIYQHFYTYSRMVKFGRGIPQPSQRLYLLPGSDSQSKLSKPEGSVDFSIQPESYWSFWLFPVRSPLLGESACLSFFLRLLRCFTSARSRLTWYYPGATWHYPSWVSPFRNLRLITVTHTWPKLIAVYRVFHRHLLPRHPLYALTF